MRRKLGIGSMVVVLGILLARPASAAEPGDFLWAVREGGPGWDRGFCIASFPDGSQMVAGICESPAVFGEGEANETTLTRQVFMARLAPDGTLAWVKAGGGYARSVATFEDESFAVVGEYPSSALFGEGEANQTLLVGSGAFVARYNSDGTLRWARNSGVLHDEAATGVAVFADGSMVVVGYTLPPSGGFGAADTGLFVARYAADGAPVWTKTVDSPVDDFATGVAALPDGSFVVTGAYGAGAIFGAGEAGQTALGTAGGLDVFVARYASTGALAWVHRAGGLADDRGAAVVAFPDGSLAVAGSYEGQALFGQGGGGPVALPAFGGLDIFVARYTGAGVLVWAKRAGGPQADQAWSAATLPDGSLAVAGEFRETATFGSGGPNQKILASFGNLDAFVAVYAGDGTLSWVKRAGGAGIERALAVASLADGSVVATGAFQATATFGLGEMNATPLLSSGQDDVFVARYAGPRQITAPATIAQECDDDVDGATVNFTFDVLAGFSDLLLVRDTTASRTLLEVAHPEDGPHGIGPVTFPHGTSTVVIELLASGTVLASATVGILVEDTVPPEISGPSAVTIELQGPMTTLTRSLLGITVSDACDPAPTVTFAPGAVPLGPTGVRAIARDATGNASVLSLEITVVDTTPPVFTVVPDDIERECRDVRGTKVDFDVLAEDLSGPVEVTCVDQDGQPVSRDGALFHVGEHTVTCTATDPSGNTATCSFLVTITDHHAPILLVPDDITVPTEPGLAFAFVEFAVTATDDCDPDAGIICVAPWGKIRSGQAFPCGTTTVVCTAWDRSGNEATASFHVTVEDREPPVIVAPRSATIVMDGSCAECGGSKSCRCGRCEARRHGKSRKRCSKRGDDATVTLTVTNLGVEVADNCDPSPTVEINPATVGPGKHEVTVVAIDDDGNRATAFLPVIVVKPPLECQILRPLDGNVDNRIRAGRTVPIRLKVTCDNVAVRDATVTIDEIVQLDGDGTPIANDAGDDELEPEGAFSLRGDRYHMNLSTEEWNRARGSRYEVLIRVQRGGHADGFCSVRFVIR